MVKVCVLDDKGEKTPVLFLVDGYEPATNTVDFIGMDIRV